jgi:hypothetical protein
VGPASEESDEWMFVQEGDAQEEEGEEQAAAV